MIKSTTCVNINNLVKTINWVKKHVAVFVLAKYELIYFTNIFKKYDYKISLKLFEHQID